MSNLLRTIQQVTRDYVDSISHRLPSIKNGTVTATSSDGTATVRVDGDTATTGSVPSIAAVKTGDRVKMVLFNRQLTILGAIQRTDKLVADTIEGGWRNLVLDSSRAVISHEYNVISGRLSEPWVEGATYTVTIKGTVNTPNRFRLFRDSGMRAATFLTDYDYERKVWTATFVCPAQYEDRDPYEFAIYNWPQEAATRASIEWIKIERGAVSTDWTPAPEDYVGKSSLLDTLYPVGSIYIDMGTDLTTCPIQRTLGGAWVREAGGRVLVGQDAAQSEFDTIGKTGGAKTHTLTTAQMPTHQHFLHNYNPGAPPTDGYSWILSDTAMTSELNARSTNVKTLPTGGGQAHNNLQPYITANIWRRTA